LQPISFGARRGGFSRNQDAGACVNSFARAISI
jgi:hypothetical protein